MSFPDATMRYELADLLRGRRVGGPGGEPGHQMYFGRAYPLSDARFIGLYDADFRAVIDFDYLPVGPDSVRLFVLTNVAGRGKPAGKTDSLSGRTFPNDRQEKPKWSFACHRAVGKWDRQEKSWQVGEWEQECTIEMAFNEPFQALGRGEDYYFLTASGKLYRAPKPAKGKHRKLEAVWNDERSPVTAFVTDVDRGRTFLFCDKGPKGKGGPFVFELGSGVRPRFYEPKLFRLGDKGPAALRRVVGYARVLQTLGYVKDPAASKGR
jgi:hypothetical protein